MAASSSNVHDPVNIATYSISTAELHGAHGPTGPHLMATYGPSTKGKEVAKGFVTLTVESNGVYVMDSESDQPLISYALGPDVHYACPAVSRPEGTNLVTYAVIQRYPGMESSSEDRAVWAWTSSPDDPTTLATDRKVFEAPFPVYALYAPRSLPSKLLVVSTTGTVACLAGDQMTSTESSSSEGSSSKVLKSIVIPRQKCSFAPTTVAPAAVVVTAVKETGNPGVKLNVTLFDNDGNVDTGSSGSVSISNGEHGLRDLTLDYHGNLSVLWTNSSWLRYTLSRPSSDGPLVITPHEPPLQFNRQKITTNTSTSIMHLHSTIALSASLEPGHSTAEILLWDLRYPALLASRSLTLPSSLPNPQVQLVPTLDMSQALLVVSTLPSKARGSGATSWVYSIPLTVPATSSLAHAIAAARNHSLSEWVESGSAENEGLITSAEKETLARLDDALTREGVQAGNDVVVRFQRSTGLANLSKEFAGEVCKRLLQPLPKAADPKSSLSKARVPPCIMPLLERELVTNGCVAHELGVVGAIMDRSDRMALRLCLELVNDIPEDALIQILKRILLSESGMEVDSASSPSAAMSLEDFLVQLALYPTTAGPLRVAMKKHLSVDDLPRILEALDRIVGEEARGILNPTLGHPKKTVFAQTITLFQNILDTFLLAILTSSSNASLQTSLLSLSAHIERSAALVDMASKLRGPLEPFVRAHEERILAEKEQQYQKKGHVEQKWDKLRKRTERHRKMDESVAVYQIEKLVL